MARKAPRKRSKVALKQWKAVSATKLSGNEQRDCVMERLHKSQCAECGEPTKGYHFCSKCMIGYPRQIKVHEPKDGWQYIIHQSGPNILGLVAFTIMRHGVDWHIKKRPELKGEYNTFEQAKEEALKSQARTTAALKANCGYW